MTKRRRSSRTPWQTKCKNASQRCGALFEAARYTNVEFLVGLEPDQEVIKAHKIFLASATPVFEAMFYGQMAERQTTIPIPDIDPETFRAMLRFIYVDNIVVSSYEEGFNLYHAAKKYMLQKLTKECTKYFKTLLGTAKYIILIHEFATMNEEKELLDETLKAMKMNTLKILNYSNFVKVQWSTLITIFSLDEMNCTELDLLKALEKYVQAQEELTESSAEEEQDDQPKEPKEKPNNRAALEKIRFLAMSPREFAEADATFSLLTESEQLAILMNIVTDKTNVPMPAGFSNCREARKTSFKAPCRISRNGRNKPYARTTTLLNDTTSPSSQPCDCLSRQCY